MEIKPIAPQDKNTNNGGSGTAPEPSPTAQGPKPTSAQPPQPQAQPPLQGSSPPSPSLNQSPAQSPPPPQQDTAQPTVIQPSQAAPASGVSDQSGPQPFTMDVVPAASEQPRPQSVPAQPQPQPQAEVSSPQPEASISAPPAPASTPAPQEAVMSAPAPTVIQSQQNTMPDQTDGAAVAPVAPAASSPTQVQPAASPTTAAQQPSPQQAVTTTTQTVTPAGPTPPQQPSSPKAKKKGLFAMAGVALFALIAGGVVFGYVIPNRPENVFSTGLDRSGQAINALMVQLSEMDTADRMNKMQATADMQIEMEGVTFEGDARIRLDETSSESTFSIQSAASGANFELSGDVLTTLSDQSNYPDVYFQLTGISALGLDAFVPGISRYDGRWVHLPSSFLDEAIGPLEQTEATEEMPSAEVATDFMIDISEVVRDNLLTSDEEKAVFEINEIVGEEDVEGRSTYRYAVSLREQRFETFCVALAEKVEASEFYGLISDTAATGPLDTSGCAEAAKDLNEENIDIWVDRRTKLISKVRFANPEADQEYSELGLRYEGGDDLGLYLRGISEDETVELSMQTNLETLRTSGSVLVEQNGLSGYQVTMNIAVEPYQDTINVTPPETAVTFEQMAEELFGNSTTGFTLGRQTDDSEGLFVDDSIGSVESDAPIAPSGPEIAPMELPTFREVVRAYNNPPSTETLE